MEETGTANPLWEAVATLARDPVAQVWPCQLSSVHKPCATQASLWAWPGTLPFNLTSQILKAAEKWPEPVPGWVLK